MLALLGQGEWAALNIRPSQVAARSVVCGGWSADRGWGQGASARIFNGRQVVWPARAKFGFVETIGGRGACGVPVAVARDCETRARLRREIGQRAIGAWVHVPLTLASVPLGVGAC